MRALSSMPLFMSISRSRLIIFLQVFVTKRLIRRPLCSKARSSQAGAEFTVSLSFARTQRKGGAVFEAPWLPF